MEMAETIYEVIVEPSCLKKLIEQMLTMLVTAGKREDNPYCQKNYSSMGKGSEKLNQRYVDYPWDVSQLTCLIHGPVHISYEFKVKNYFGNEYSKGGPFKERSQEPTTKKDFGMNQQVNSIFQKTVDEIILQET